MTERYQVYRCMVCGNMVEVLHSGAGELVCCNQPMSLLRENTTDAATEKHVPVVEAVPGGIRASVGSVPHPMIEEHYIEWIEAIDGEQASRKFLSPGGAPQAEFCLKEAATVREYCNLHGLWRK
jgi:superoxide reductase